MTAQEIINAALRRINVIFAQQSASVDQENNCLEALQNLIQSWSVERLLVYYIEEAESYSLTGANSFTIGDGGDFDTVRPVRILDGTYISAGGQDHYLRIISVAEYNKIALKAVQVTPYYIAYNPDYPLGDIFLYPQPGSGDTLYLTSVKPLTEPSAITTEVQFPPEYNRCLINNLAVEVAPEFAKLVTPTLARNAEKSKMAIENYNAEFIAVNPVKLEILKLARKYNIDAG